MKRALTIAGSDSGGGAGIQADLKTFCAWGVYGMSAVTAVTAQNTVRVADFIALPPEFVARQIDEVVTDIGCDAAKTGMLANAGIVEAVADRAAAHDLTLVVDPVMVAKSGDRLLAEDAVETVRVRLVELAAVLTPNAPEAEVITGRPVRDLSGMWDAARALVEAGAGAVLVKGGHLPQPAGARLPEALRDAVVWVAGVGGGPPDGPPEGGGAETEAAVAYDLWYDGSEARLLAAPYVRSRATHGTGCTLSAAVAAALALGHPPAEAVVKAKRFLLRCIREAVPLGRGTSPTNHLIRFDPDER
jgi:hydroxymethylpyrimidine/phosphomethylpyrimidine kinase